MLPTKLVSNSSDMISSDIAYINSYLIIDITPCEPFCISRMALCTGLSGKEPHRQVGVDWMVISVELSDVMVSTLVRNANDVGSIPAQTRNHIEL